MARWPYLTSRWKKLRLAKLSINPVCEICERLGRVELAHAVDHCVAISAGGPAFPELTGLMSLCESHHNEKTAAFDRQGGNVTGRRFKGCDADGNPVDPNDSWHR